ncbi:MAG: phosphohydrolase [Synergistales bacterium]|nr:phosphohydrolase [Synergistales bacterium]
MNPILTHIISHTDLDGVVSAALAWHFHHARVPLKISLAGYGIVDNLILESLEREENMVVLDLFCQKTRTVDEIDKRFNHESDPFIFDHHESNLSRYSNRPWLHLDTRYCAAKVYFLWLQEHTTEIRGKKILHDMERMVSIANDRDMWINSLEESRLWQALITLCGPWSIFTRLTSVPGSELRGHELSAARNFIERQEKRFSQALEIIGPLKRELAFVGDGVLEFGDISDFGGLVLDSIDDPPKILASASRKITGEWAVSLRSREGIAGKVVSLLKDGKNVRGGGHEDAAALYFPPHYSQERIRDSIEAALKAIKEKDRPMGPTLGDFFREALGEDK